MKTNRDIKYFLYVRKSTDTEDKQMASIDDQIAEMTQLALRLNLNVVEVITESKSAKYPEARKEFNRMIERIQDGEADGILCWKLNRLARNPVDGGKVSWLLQQGIIKNIQTYSRDYNPWDNVLLMAVELGMANQYSNDLGVDVRRSQRSKAARGWYPASILPLGYIHNRDYRMGENEIVPDPERFDLVKALWRKMLTGNYSIADIRREGKKIGLRNRSGKEYSTNAYWHTFTNTFYYGAFEWNDEDKTKQIFKGIHEPMVTEAEFDRVQMFLGKRGKPTKVNKNDFALRDPLFCGECGCSVTAERKIQAICTTCKTKFSIKTQTMCPKCHTDVSQMKKPSIVDKTYYRCTKKRGQCSQKYVEEKELERQINEVISSIAIPKDFYLWSLEAIKYLHRNEIHDQESIVTQNRKRETELLNKLEGLVMMRAEGEISKEQLAKSKDSIETDLKDVRKNVRELHERAVDWVGIADNYIGAAFTAQEKFENGSNQDKREILSSLGSNLVIKDKKLGITISSPLLGLRSTYNLSKSKNTTLEPKIPQLKQGYSGQVDPENSRLLPDKDSNLDTLDQNQVSYH